MPGKQAKIVTPPMLKRILRTSRVRRFLPATAR
jgi:hypothetical protein